jgi:hypothetical protein
MVNWAAQPEAGKGEPGRLLACPSFPKRLFDTCRVGASEDQVAGGRPPHRRSPRGTADRKALCPTGRGSAARRPETARPGRSQCRRMPHAED